jgi:hypothetical protein
MKALQELIKLDLATHLLWNVDQGSSLEAAYISIYPLKLLDRDVIQSSPQNRILSYIFILHGRYLQINMKITVRDSLQDFLLLI